MRDEHAAIIKEVKVDPFLNEYRMSFTGSITIKYPTTMRGFEKLWDLDVTFIGTPDYLGFAYFWGHEYKHYLRGATAHQRKRVHNAFVLAGLPLAGSSDKHDAIIKKVFDT